MMRICSVIIGGLMLLACGGDTGTGTTTSAEAKTDSSGMLPAWQRLELPILADNVRHDTLLVHTTYDLGEGRFLMAAQNNNYNKEGIRLYLYRPQPDSSAQLLAWSKPGYDSETMLPTFFTNGNRAEGLVIIANMGERQSWGQEAFWLKDSSINSLGFIDVAIREWKTLDDSTYQFRTSIAPRTLVTGAGGNFDFAFSGDSLQLYDDLQGHSELMLPASSVRYRFQDGWALWLNGRRISAPPAS